MPTEMRVAMREAIEAEMRKNDAIVVLHADLAKANGLADLSKEFGERAFNVGIAEQNMASMAAGMASYGMVPIINSFAAFATRRICDQAMVSIAYAGQNVKIIGTDPGICGEANGGTHMAVEDIGVMRSIPNMCIVEPCDVGEMRLMIGAILRMKGPVYLRTARKILPDVHTRDYQFVFGKADILRKGKDITIIAAGITVSEAMQAADLLLGKEHISAEVINLHTLKPIDTETVAASAQKTGVVLTVENHNILGGMRAAVAETLSFTCPVRIWPLGIQDSKGEVGNITYLKKRFEIDRDSIAATAKRAVEAKKI
jgi:transketolase